MFDKLKEDILNFFTSRLTLMTIVFSLLGGILVYRCFVLQIVHGQEYLDDFVLRTEKTRDIACSRGSIRDRNGNILAYDELAYSVKIEDVYESSSNKNKELNATVYDLIRMIEKNGDHIITDFNIVLDEHGNYVYNVSGTRLMRFLADVYGHTTIDQLKDEERTATPQEVLNYLGKLFGLGRYEVEDDSKSDFLVGEGYTSEEFLKMMNIRYAMNLTRFRKYVGTTVAKDVSVETVAVIMENLDQMDGVSIVEDTVRRYNESEYFAHILGYTGKIDSDELTSLNEQDLADGGTGERYTSNDVVGKSGIEKSMEATLQGVKGSETVCVDNMGKVISILDRQEAQAGNDVYLTIDKDLQINCYKILEERVAGILVDKIINAREAPEVTNGDIKIPIYDVYYATINNSIIDIAHFTAADAGETERAVYEKYLEYREKVYQRLREELLEKKTPYNKLSLEYKMYQLYIVNDILRDDGIIDSELLDRNDSVQLAWSRDEVISLHEYLTHCIASNWIDVDKLRMEQQYADSTEIYDGICDYIFEALNDELEFQKLIYRFMIESDAISGRQICMILCEQNTIEIPQEDREKLYDGAISSYEFMKNRILYLDITPAQLALDPCTAAIVVIDVNTGDVLALVSYPGYDNNMMANSVDPEYYSKLLADKTSPLLNYATQYAAAPGSTFKMVSSTAALMEGEITLNSKINCTGSYTQVTPSPRCWRRSGHGSLNLTGAIQNSCNFFFYDMGYRFATKSGSYNAQDGLDVLAKYAQMYGLTEKSGVEIEESQPSVSDELPIPSAIGQGTNSFTAVGLTRYVATVANGGNCYNLTLLEHVQNKEGDILMRQEPTMYGTVDLPVEYWNAMRLGLRRVVEGKSYFNELSVKVAGKTGTAQQITSRPNHALFVGYAPYENPEIAITVRIPFGYSSDYAAQTAKDVVSCYFGLEPLEDIIDGMADTPEAGVTINEI
ncbi:MAG: penicillin-binding protein [Lachnospiraceae bacterium]|nr:penicillin-binding protein [Lachnospiraceae bacterium]